MAVIINNLTAVILILISFAVVSLLRRYFKYVNKSLPEFNYFSFVHAVVIISDDRVSEASVEYSSRTIRINADFYMSLNRRQIESVLLHEVGHLVSGECQLLADSYACKKGYARELYQVLSRINTTKPEELKCCT